MLYSSRCLCNCWKISYQRFREVNRASCVRSAKRTWFTRIPSQCWELFCRSLLIVLTKTSQAHPRFLSPHKVIRHIFRSTAREWKSYWSKMHLSRFASLMVIIYLYIKRGHLPHQERCPQRSSQMSWMLSKDWTPSFSHRRTVRTSQLIFSAKFSCVQCCALSARLRKLAAWCDRFPLWV